MNVGFLFTRRTRAYPNPKTHTQTGRFRFPRDVEGIA